MSEVRYEVIAFYKFVRLSEERVAELRNTLTERAQSLGIQGLMILACEGCNATLAGTPEAAKEYRNYLTGFPELSDLEFKISYANRPPFRRFKIDVRKEIVTFDACKVAPGPGTAKKLSPQQWQHLLESGEDIVLLDTRNTYETDVGIFRGAIDPRITKFSQFSEYVQRSGIPKDKKVLMYCTGGIRCEKASLEMERLGYSNVFQLGGGILKYLEEVQNGSFDGECFVFDHRVAVDRDLRPSQRYKLCPHCGNPADQPICCEKCARQTTVCSGCLQREFKRTCSKNCANHLERVAQGRASRSTV